MAATTGVALIRNVERLPPDVLKQWYQDAPVDECRRADKIKSQHRLRQFLAGRELLRNLVKQGLGFVPKIDVADTGRLSLSNSSVACSISHSHSVVVVAYSSLGCIGVDVERIAARHRPGIEHIVMSFFSAEEQAVWKELKVAERKCWFYRQWTQKEALAKLDGNGLSLSRHLPPQGVELDHFAIGEYMCAVAYPAGESPVFFSGECLFVENTFRMVLSATDFGAE